MMTESPTLLQHTVCEKKSFPFVCSALESGILWKRINCVSLEETYTVFASVNTQLKVVVADLTRVQ